MGKIHLVDSTLRDGGYINDWKFGEKAIRAVCKKLGQAGIDAIEVGFVKGNDFSKDRTVFPDVQCASDLITPKNPNVMYIGMLDMSAPVPKERICSCDGKSFDALRVIFKKNKIEEGYDYCKYVKEQGYKVFVQLVGTDNYTDKEFVETIHKFNTLKPDVVYIVDSFGLIKRKHFLRLLYLADNNLAPGIALGYHSHNNLQQAFGNAEAMAESNLRRDMYIDACVFGMGRGAGNLNLELFAEYMNENFNSHYRIEPMLEIADEYLNDIYKKNPWGYSLPFYLSASNACHPNYAIYYGKKNTLTVKSFNELLKSIEADDRKNYSKDKAEKYYLEYQKNFLDDRETLQELQCWLNNRSVLLLAPGASLKQNREKVKQYIVDNKPVVVSLNFVTDDFKIDGIFSSNMRRYHNLDQKSDIKRIITSNIQEAKYYDYMVNYASYISEYPEIVDNSGLMLLKLLMAIGVKTVAVAGMDGYVQRDNYFNEMLDFQFKDMTRRNLLIADELKDIRKKINIEFLTPSLYESMI